MKSEKPSPARSENSAFSLLLNIVLPVLLLTQGDRLLDDPKWILVLALTGPVVYFAHDLRRRKKANFISILGFVSVLLTGGVGLLELPRFWFIVKETAIPGLIGSAILISAFTRFPLIRVFVFSPAFFDVERIQEALASNGKTREMDKLLRKTTVLLSGSFFLSALLNFLLARHFVKTEPQIDAAQFNAEVGAMTGWSFLVIALPSMLFMAAVLFAVLGGIRKFTGLNVEQAMRAESKSQPH